MSDMDPRRYYDDSVEAEWERLERTPVHRLEFDNTVDYLERELPEEGRILDAGGGPGRYTTWLAERNYEVVHGDFSGEQVAFARGKVRERGPRADHAQFDVRSLPFADDAFDAVCCLGGVLSHVLDPDERRQAVGELRRVARPDAPVFVSVIGRIGAVLYSLVEHFPDSHGILEPLTEDGDYTEDRAAKYGGGEGWAEAHYFRAEELASLLEGEGLTVDHLVGLEGLAAHVPGQAGDAPEAAVESLRSLAKRHREDPTFVDVSHHILAVCRN